MSDVILVIEDNRDIRENIVEILGLANYSVLSAENGKKGIELACERRPDLVLCDIVMPVLDGYEVLRAFEKIPQMTGIPFIFLSAKSERTDFRMAMDLGADDYLVKPFSGDELLRIVSTRLKKSHLMKRGSKNPPEKLDDFINVLQLENGMHELSGNRIVKKLKKKALLFIEGDTPGYLYFVVSGKLKVFKSNEAGKEYILNIYKTHDFFGYTVLLENTRYSESAIAIEDSEIMLIPREDFFRIMNSNREVAITFVRMISGNLLATEEKLLRLAYDSARKRVAEALIFISNKYRRDNSDELLFTLRRENISAISGISQESVSRHLSDFKQEGLIEIMNGSVRILDLKKLETIRS